MIHFANIKVFLHMIHFYILDKVNTVIRFLFFEITIAWTRLPPSEITLHSDSFTPTEIILVIIHLCNMK